MEVQENDVISYISFVLNRYNKAHQLLDRVGCDELVKSLIIYNKLEDYIKDVKYVDSSEYRVNMSYSYFDKTINITNDFIKGVKRSSLRLIQLLNIHDEIVSTNLDIVHALIHEVMHAKQYKLIDTTDDELLKNVLIKSLAAASYDYASDKESALKFAKAAQETKLYSLLPSELNAEVLSMKQTIDIINRLNIKEKYKYLNLYELSIKLTETNSYESKYFSVKSPFDKFIKLRKKYIKEPFDFRKKDFKKYDIDTRLSYGFSINKWEYNQLQNEITDIIKMYVNNK